MAAGCANESPDEVAGSTGVTKRTVTRTVTAPPATVTEEAPPAPTVTVTKKASPKPAVTVTVTATAPAPEPEQTGIGDGTYLVGPEIETGVWKSSGAEGGLCYADTQTRGGAILEQEVANQGSVIIRIGGSAYTFTSNGCGTWSKVG
jgi:hypothetical protein